MLRALVEFRIRGVKTNIPFLFRVLSHDVFVTGNTWTTVSLSDSFCIVPYLTTNEANLFFQFIDDTPQLFNLVSSQNRAQKILAYLGDLVVNGSTIKGQAGEPGLSEEIPIPTLTDPEDETKTIDTSVPCAIGWRNIIKEKGPEGFAKAVRDYPGVLIMGKS